LLDEVLWVFVVGHHCYFVKQQNKKAKEDSFKRFNFSCNSYGKNPPFIAAGFPNEKRVERLVDTMKKGVNIYEKLV